jgi:hypothetical protein
LTGLGLIGLCEFFLIIAAADGLASAVSFADWEQMRDGQAVAH